MAPPCTLHTCSMSLSSACSLTAACAHSKSRVQNVPHHTTSDIICRSGTDYTAVLAANVVGPFLVSKHFLPLLMKKKTRVIVNSSSICGSISAASSNSIGGENPLGSVLLPYNTSKAALNMRMSLQPCHHM